MATVDFTSAYSDATKGATLKALQLRQKQAEEEMQQQMAPRQIAHPLQGLAQIAGTIGAGIREGRAAAQEQAGRQQLAQLLAGGLKDPTSMAQAMMLDPELAAKYQEHQWQSEQDLQKHGWDVEAATQRVKDELEKARIEHGYRGEETTQAAALGSDEAKWEAGLKAGTVSQEAYDTHQKQVATEAAARGPDQWGPMTPDIAAQYGGDVAANPGKYHRNAKTGDVELIAPVMAGAVQDRKALWQEQDAYVNTSATLGQLNEAKNLLTQGINWGRIEGPVKTQLGASGVGSAEDQAQAQRTLRYNTIMGGNALQELAATLKGASSDKDVAIFMEIMNNPAMDPQTKAKAIDDMVAKVSGHQELQKQRIQALGGDAPQAQPQTSPDEKAANLDRARKAIAAGADPALVKKRLADAGIDASEL